MKRIILILTIIMSSTVAHADVIGGRPHGCPWKFCGCGASIELYGRIVPHLNLARNWLHFPRTEPASNTVAVRRHHVFVLKHHVSGNVWMVHDSNSGGHKTRLHQRSIAGYTIVNPFGTYGGRKWQSHKHKSTPHFVMSDPISSPW